MKGCLICVGVKGRGVEKREGHGHSEVCERMGMGILNEGGETVLSPCWGVRVQIHQNGKSRPQSPLKTLADCYFLHFVSRVCVHWPCVREGRR